MATFDHLGLLFPTTEATVAAARFFADVLDLPVTGDPADGYAEVAAGAMTIALHRGSMVPLTAHGGTLLQLSSDDVDAETDRIAGRGGVVAAGPLDTDWGTRSSWISGPENVLVELYRFTAP